MHAHCEAVFVAAQEKLRLKRGLEHTQPAHIDELIVSAAAHSKDVKSELSALARRRTVLVRDATRKIQELARSSDYTIVSTGIVEYEGFSKETQPYWSVLNKRGATLLERCQTALKEICASDDPALIAAVLENAVSAPAWLEKQAGRAANEMNVKHLNQIVSNQKKRT